jgi:hypothetical protein
VLQEEQLLEPEVFAILHKISPRRDYLLSRAMTNRLWRHFDRRAGQRA